MKKIGDTYSDETRQYIYDRDGHRCQFCGDTLRANEFDLAHMIGKGKGNRATYGNEIIDHPHNLRVSCQNRVCNDGISINCNSKQVAQHVAEIKEMIAANVWGWR